MWLANLLYWSVHDAKKEEGMEKILCRSGISDDCYDGRLSADIYGEDEPGMAGDGTFNGVSVVCDACYLKLGTPTNDQMKEMGI